MKRILARCCLINFISVFVLSYSLTLCFVDYFEDLSITCFFPQVVQSKLGPEENVEENFARLLRYLDMAFSVITSFRHLCSRAMRMIFRTMMTESQKKFGSEVEGGKVGYTTVTGFLFLRLFVPAFMVHRQFVVIVPLPALQENLDTQDIRVHRRHPRRDAWSNLNSNFDCPPETCKFPRLRCQGRLS
jgi:hypothetical protein